jgi:ribose 5-phosphate isomerase B
MDRAMKIAVGNDHRGVGVKQRVVGLLGELGHHVVDYGAKGPASSDYPDSALLVAEDVGTGRADRGILICATGHGMCIAANKVLGIRAANCRDMIDAEFSRRHNDTNVLCLSADLIGEELIDRIVRAWLLAEFEGGRHARRVDKITSYEKEHTRPPAKPAAPALPATASAAPAK